MKPNRFLLIGILVFALACIFGSCKDTSKENPQGNEYPITTVAGEQTLVGTIGHTPNPPNTDGSPTLPGTVLGLEVKTETYILVHDGYMVWDGTFTVSDVEYTLEDEVEVTGTVSETQYSSSSKCLFLEIETIRKK